MLYITNAFSINMIDPTILTTNVSFDQITEAEIKTSLAKRAKETIVPAIGHADLAAIVGNALSISPEPNRITVKLTSRDDLLVAQYIGPRLPEGTTELPADAEIRWFYVSLI